MSQHKIHESTHDESGDLPLMKETGEASVHADGPLAPIITSEPAAGLVEGDTLTLVGTAEPATKIVIFYWGAVVTSTVVDDMGRWMVHLRSLEWGNHIYAARAVRKDGRTSPMSEPVMLTVIAARGPGAATHTTLVQRVRGHGVRNAWRRLHKSEESNELLDSTHATLDWAQLMEAHVMDAEPPRNPGSSPTPMQTSAVTELAKAEVTSGPLKQHQQDARSPSLVELVTLSQLECAVEPVRDRSKPADGTTVTLKLKPEPPRFVPAHPTSTSTSPAIVETLRARQEVVIQCPEAVKTTEVIRPPADMGVEMRRQRLDAVPIWIHGISPPRPTTWIEAREVEASPKMENGNGHTGESGIPATRIQHILEGGTRAWFRYRKQHTS